MPTATRPQTPTVSPVARAGPRSINGASHAPGRSRPIPGPVAVAAGPHPTASTAAAAPGCDATRLSRPPLQAPPRLAATPLQERLAAALSPAAVARGVVLASELVAADDATGRDQVPPPSAATLPAASPADATQDVDQLRDDAGPVTRAACERAARAGRWVGLATPAAWQAALERDEERHTMALGLLRKEHWGLYERQRLLDREVSQLWLAVLDLQETLRRALRGDPAQAALFGLIVERQVQP